jgi:hypothetical protein
MNHVTHQSQQKKPVLFIYRLQRLFLAVCIVLGIVATLALVITNPPYYSLQNGVPAMLATYANVSAVMAQAHFVSMVLAVYLLPVSLLAMAWLAMRRSPWLASISILVVLIGTLPLAAFAAQDAFTYDLVGLESNPLFITIAQRFNSDGVMSYYSAMFIIGAVFAPTLIGITLWRTRAVPTWAAVLITFSRLLVFLYPFFPGLPGVYVQLLSWTILLIGSIPAALAILRVPYNENQLAQDQ